MIDVVEDWRDEMDRTLRELPVPNAREFSADSDLCTAQAILRLCASRCIPESIGEDWCWRAHDRLQQRLDRAAWAKGYRPI